MTNRFDAARLQPLLIVIALVATVIAALALLLAGRTADRRAEQREQVYFTSLEIASSLRSSQ